MNLLQFHYTLNINSTKPRSKRKSASSNVKSSLKNYRNDNCSQFHTLQQLSRITSYKAFAFERGLLFENRNIFKVYYANCKFISTFNNPNNCTAFDESKLFVRDGQIVQEEWVTTVYIFIKVSTPWKIICRNG